MIVLQSAAQEEWGGRVHLCGVKVRVAWNGVEFEFQKEANAVSRLIAIRRASSYAIVRVNLVYLRYGSRPSNRHPFQSTAIH